ncbi:actin cortical patch SUR7/pH-response regulator pali [Bombardia bombarda]|uniref:Actin cortical patch SUR7/pH-response regulator pali n=1 Tax=Bombardia bombarda TaxID=252184 RepID=A0AA39XAB7_9PEZI|nr:actin cortical patch SUR7/pH-response regulator pali [Bombardia bombarda]
MKLVSIGIPIVASVAAFVLVLLALIAGTSPGRMEDYDIITFNTSSLGKNLVNTATTDDKPTTTTSGLCDDFSGILGKACATATSAAGSVESDVLSALNDIGNDIADKLADELGIHEFYSLHTLSICEGDFSPNATSQDPGRNVTRCHNGLKGGYNVSALFDQELQVGPFNLTLRDLGVTDDIQSDIDTLNSLIKAFAIILIVTVALIGVSMLLSVASLFLIRSREHLVLLSNVIISSIAAGMIILCSILITVGAHVAVSKVNDLGDDIGLTASTGSKYKILIWTAVGLMVVAFLYWLWQLISFKRHRGVGGTAQRKYPRDSEESGYHNGRGPQMRSSGRRLGFLRRS